MEWNLYQISSSTYSGIHYSYSICSYRKCTIPIDIKYIIPIPLSVDAHAVTTDNNHRAQKSMGPVLLQCHCHNYYYESKTRMVVKSCNHSGFTLTYYTLLSVLVVYTNLSTNTENPVLTTLRSVKEQMPVQGALSNPQRNISMYKWDEQKDSSKCHLWT